MYRPEEEDEAGVTLIKWLRNNGWNCPVLIYCSNLVRVISSQSSHSMVLGATTPTQLDLYLGSMNEGEVSVMKL